MVFYESLKLCWFCLLFFLLFLWLDNKLSYLPVNWSFPVPAEVCCWAPLVKFSFLSFLFHLFIDILYLVMCYSHIFLCFLRYVLQFLNIFGKADLKPLSNNSNFWASSGTVFGFFFSCTWAIFSCFFPCHIVFFFFLFIENRKLKITLFFLPGLLFLLFVVVCLFSDFSEVIW